MIYSLLGEYNLYIGIYTWNHLYTLERDFGDSIRRKINEIRNSDGIGGA